LPTPAGLRSSTAAHTTDRGLLGWISLASWFRSSIVQDSLGSKLPAYVAALRAPSMQAHLAANMQSAANGDLDEADSIPMSVSQSSALIPVAGARRSSPGSSLVLEVLAVMRRSSMTNAVQHTCVTGGRGVSPQPLGEFETKSGDVLRPSCKTEQHIWQLNKLLHHIDDLLHNPRSLWRSLNIIRSKLPNALRDPAVWGHISRHPGFAVASCMLQLA
jgi:hypothetical protein